MKKLIAQELIQNQLEILVDAKGITRYILARRREKQDGDTHWQLFQGNTHIDTSPYRNNLYAMGNDLYARLTDFAVKSA
jgi:hypothetical protein